MPDEPKLPPMTEDALQKKAKEIAEKSCLLGTCNHPEHQQGTVIQ